MSDESLVIELDDDDYPILLARAPGQVADQGSNSGVIVKRGARSGNPNADTATGRFQKKGDGNEVRDDKNVDENPVAVTRTGIPQGVTIEQWEKRLDMVRDAAREIAAPDEENAQKFLEGKVADLSQVNIGQFLLDVRAQRVDDLTDIFYKQINSSLINKGIRVQAPKAMVSRLFGQLEDDEVTRVVTRLLNRGVKQDDVKKYVIGKIDDEERRERFEKSLGGDED